MIGPKIAIAVGSAPIKGVRGIAAIHPADYGTPPTAGYSLRKVNPSFAGNCLSVRGNTITTLTNIGFTSAARDALISDTALGSALSGNTELRVQSWFDQFGSLNLLSTSQSTGPRVRQAANGAGGSPGLRPTANTQGLTSRTADATGPFNLGGASDKMTIIMSVALLGFGGANFATSPANPSTGSTQCGTLIGFGADGTTEFLSVAETDNTVTTELNYGSFCVLRDEINMLFERSVAWGRQRTVALRFDGTTVTGFCGSKKCFSVPATFAQVTAAKIWIGSASGPAQTANAEIKEVLIWNGYALPDNDILGLVKNVGLFFNAYADPAETNDVCALVSVSQSNGVYTDGDGMSTIVSLTKALLGSTAAVHRFTGGTAANDYTAFGGSAIQKAAADYVGGTGANYWTEQDGSIGPRLATAKTNIAAAPMRTRDYVLFMAIGEQEAKGINGTASTYTGTPGDPLFGQASKQKYKDNMKIAINEVIASAGHAPLAKYIISLHKQDMYSAAYDVVRQAQLEMAEEDPTIKFVSASLDLALRPDNIHWLATDIQTKLAPRLANIIAKAKKPSLSVNVAGPKITGVQFTDGTRTAIKVTLSHAANGGTDFTPTTGISGFRVVDAGGVKTLGTVVRTSPTEITVPLTSAASGATTLQYIYGTDHDPANVVVDNATVPFPLEATRPITVAA